MCYALAKLHDDKSWYKAAFTYRPKTENVKFMIDYAIFLAKGSIRFKQKAILVLLTAIEDDPHNRDVVELLPIIAPGIADANIEIFFSRAAFQEDPWMLYQFARYLHYVKDYDRAHSLYLKASELFTHSASSIKERSGVLVGIAQIQEIFFPRY